MYLDSGRLEEAEKELILSKDSLPNTITYPQFRATLAVIYSKMGQLMHRKNRNSGIPNTTADLYHRLSLDLIQKTSPSEDLHSHVYILYEYAKYLSTIGDTTGKSSSYLTQAYDLLSRGDNLSE